MKYFHEELTYCNDYYTLIHIPIYYLDTDANSSAVQACPDGRRVYGIVKLLLMVFPHCPRSNPGLACEEVAVTWV